MKQENRSDMVETLQEIIGEKRNSPYKFGEIILLMAALTKGGKTTMATAFCHKDYRYRMVGLSNCRTQVTVDWTLTPDAEQITLTDILLNYKGVFGTEQNERITCEKYRERLHSEEGKYLQNVFGLEDKEALTSEQLEEYVLKKIKDYINSCDDKGLSNLIKNRMSNRFLRRIKVVVPPTEEFGEYLKSKGVTLVLRDTRGLLDIDPEEAEKVSMRTMQELGLDKIDAVLLFGTSNPFADTVSWYKNAYKSAFESVPVFIMTRPDIISGLYDMKYGIDQENVNLDNVRDFLASAKKGVEKGFRDLPSCYLQCYRLLEMFEIGTLSGNVFNYNYKVYNNEDLRYVYPLSSTLMQGSAKPDYDAPDYKLYELVVSENLKDMVNKIIEHNQFIMAINSQIKSDFLSELQKSSGIMMYPDYNKYSRNEVCTNIRSGDILGSRNGIVTTDHGSVRYLGAVTSAVSARIWIRSKVYSYEYPGTLVYSNGKPLIQNMPKECQTNLIRMALFKDIEDNTDHQAYFQGYYFINRYIVRQAILDVRSTGNISDDMLDAVSKQIANIIF